MFDIILFIICPNISFKEVLPEDPVIAIEEILDDILINLAISENVFNEFLTYIFILNFYFFFIFIN